MGSILGGGDEPEQTSTTVEYPDWWKKLYQPTMESLNPIYQAQAAAPVHPLAEMAYKGMAQQAMAGSPMRQGGMNYISQLMGGPQMGYPAPVLPNQPPPQGQPPPPPKSPLDDIDFSGKPPAPPKPQVSPPMPPSGPQRSPGDLVKEMNQNNMIQLWDKSLGRHIWVNAH